MNRRKEAIAHREKAMELLAQIEDLHGTEKRIDATIGAAIAAHAQVHATLAVACATMDAVDVWRIL